jgi:hypothetical protein
MVKLKAEEEEIQRKATETRISENTLAANRGQVNFQVIHGDIVSVFVCVFVREEGRERAESEGKTKRSKGKQAYKFEKESD